MDTIRLRYPARCLGCDAQIAAGSEAAWDRQAKTATCCRCLGLGVDPTPAPADPFAGPSIALGSAGASALAEFERRSSFGGDSISRRSPRLGGILRTLAGEPQHTRAWLKGAEGEMALGRMLDAVPSGWALHDRGIPGSPANIDHVVVVPSGVFVIDAKLYAGKLTKSRGQLYVGGRSKATLIEGSHKQIELVSAQLQGEPAAQVRGVLCFVRGTFETYPPFTVGGVTVHSVGTLRRKLTKDGPLSFSDRQRIAGHLSDRFPPARTG